jgi:hypothetical protein
MRVLRDQRKRDRRAALSWTERGFAPVRSTSEEQQLYADAQLKVVAWARLGCRLGLLGRREVRVRFLGMRLGLRAHRLHDLRASCRVELLGEPVANPRQAGPQLIGHPFEPAREWPVSRCLSGGEGSPGGNRLAHF